MGYPIFSPSIPLEAVSVPSHGTIKTGDLSSEVYFPDKKPKKKYNDWRAANEEKPPGDGLPCRGWKPNDADLLPFLMNAE